MRPSPVPPGARPESKILTALDSNGAWTLVLAPDSVVVDAALATRALTAGSIWWCRASSPMAAVEGFRRFLLRTKCTLQRARDQTRGPYATIDELIDASLAGMAASSPRSHSRPTPSDVTSSTPGDLIYEGLLHRSRAGRSARRSRIERSVALRDVQWDPSVEAHRRSAQRRMVPPARRD